MIFGGAGDALTVLGFSLTMVEHSKERLVWALSLSIVATYTYVAFFSIGRVLFQFTKQLQLVGVSLCLLASLCWHGVSFISSCRKLR